MYKIGFSSKYYTLWWVEVETFIGHGGRKGERVTKTYIRNIAMDEETARAKCPGAEVDMTLRGHTSYSRIHWTPLPTDVFPCGKHMGESISGCTDWGYLYWAIDTYMLMDEARDLAIDALLKCHDYCLYNGRVMTAASAEILARAEAERDAVAAAIDLNGSVDLHSVSNVKEWDDSVFGSSCDIARVSLIWDREMLDSRYYNGYEYFLPLKGGKAKRINGKTLHIVADRYERSRDRLAIYVKDFEIL